MKRIGLFAALGVCFALGLLAACGERAPDIAQRLERERWAEDNFQAAGTTPDRLYDTAHGVFAVWEFPLHQYYQTQAYGPHWAGSIRAIDGGVLSVNASGEFLYFDTVTRRVERLNIRYENNRDDFLTFMRPAQNPWPNYFAFYDLALHKRSDGVSLLASVDYWHPEENCFTLRVIELRAATLRGLRSGRFDTENWEVIFETQPCLPGDNTTSWYGHEGGGAINGDDLYVSIGHFGLDGTSGREIAPQNRQNSYGKIYRLDLRTRQSSLESLGHRNNQGLVFANGALWTVEHGPQGGDELNLVRRGENYGWPYVTLGTQYGQEEWTVGRELAKGGIAPPPARHFGYTEPVFAWVPSIGPSKLTYLSGFTSAWEGDLVVGGMTDRSIRRLRIVDGRVQFAERIQIGSRVRGVSQYDGGFLYVLTDENVLLEFRPHDQSLQMAAGAEVTAAAYESMPGWQEAQGVLQRCGVCHSYERGVQSRIAPNLYGIVNRGVAATDYENYTDGWRALGGVWTEERLDSLLQRPGVVPTSIMSSQRPVPDASVREAIIAYLRSLSDDEQH